MAHSLPLRVDLLVGRTHREGLPRVEHLLAGRRIHREALLLAGRHRADHSHRAELRLVASHPVDHNLQVEDHNHPLA